MPQLYSKAHSTLLFFTLSLGARTLYKAEEQVEFINKFVKMIASHEEELKDHLNDFNIKLNNPISLSLKAVAEVFPLASDLHFKLLINKTNIPFIISDNPVVFYNQFLENIKKYGSNISIAVKGLQFFLPISPNHVLIFYDQTVYKIGKAKSRLVEVNNPDDISAINGLQYINSNITLYFNDGISQKDISAIKKNFNKYRSLNKVNLKEYSEVENDSDFQKSLLHMYKEDICCKLSLSFIKILKKAKKYDLGKKVVHIRNEKLLSVYNEFKSLKDKKLYKASEFNKFLFDKIKSET